MATNKLKIKGMSQIHKRAVITTRNPKTNGENKWYFDLKLTLQKKLQAFGLTTNESKTYMFLSQNGPKKAIEISRAINIPRTEIYHLLLVLKNKGVVTLSSQIKPKRFYAVTIDKAMESIIENQKKKIDELKLLKDDMEFIWRVFQNNLHLTEKKYAQTVRI